MRYQPPFGISDADAPYINGDPSVGRQGSILPAGAAEYPQREIVNFITKSDISPSDGDLYQLTRASRNQWVNYCSDTGSVNQLSVALDPPLTAYRAGLPLRVFVANNNSGSCTINVNSLGPRPLVRAGGTELEANDLRTGMIALLVDDGTRFQVTNYLGALGGTVNNFISKLPYAEDSNLVANNNIIVNFPGPAGSIPQDLAGEVCVIKIKNANVSSVNNGAVTITINGRATKQLNRNDGQPMMGRDLLASEAAIIEYNTTFWQVIRLVRSQVIQFWGINTVVYTSGSGNFIVPEGVFVLREIEITGGGGGGGGGGGAIAGVGGGGNGGCSICGAMVVTPGQSIPWAVGGGGSAGGYGGYGGNAGDTTFGTWRAAGGKGGHPDSNPGDAWGTSNGGTEFLSGGQSDAGWVIAGYLMRGGHGGGTALGGQGGNGSSYGGTNGNPGINPGGGGGGGSPGTWWAGGPGANGKILIRY